MKVNYCLLLYCRCCLSKFWMSLHMGCHVLNGCHPHREVPQASIAKDAAYEQTRDLPYPKCSYLHLHCKEYAHLCTLFWLEYAVRRFWFYSRFSSASHTLGEPRGAGVCNYISKKAWMWSACLKVKPLSKPTLETTKEAKSYWWCLWCCGLSWGDISGCGIICWHILVTGTMARDIHVWTQTMLVMYEKLIWYD